MNIDDIYNDVFTDEVKDEVKNELFPLGVSDVSFTPISYGVKIVVINDDSSFIKHRIAGALKVPEESISRVTKGMYVYVPEKDKFLTKTLVKKRKKIYE